MMKPIETDEDLFKKKLENSTELAKIFAYFYEKNVNQKKQLITVREIAKWLVKSEAQVRQWFYILKDFSIIKESPTRLSGKTAGYFLNRNDSKYKKYVKFVERMFHEK